MAKQQKKIRKPAVFEVRTIWGFDSRPKVVGKNPKDRTKMAEKKQIHIID
jgi:hypothetical protein